jgi:hypothetical protein
MSLAIVASSNSVYTEFRFWLLIVFSIILPFAIYGVLMLKRAISRVTVLFFGFLLVVIAGIDIYLLHSLSAAISSSATADKAFLISEISLALYLLPALFAGIGINVVSHILVSHLVEAEERFKEEKAEKDAH